MPQETVLVQDRAGHYLLWLSNRILPSLSVGVSRTGLTKPSNSESSFSSTCAPLTKSFSHSSPVESSEAEVGPLWACRTPGLRAARRMSSSVRDRSHTGMERFIPAKVKEGRKISMVERDPHGHTNFSRGAITYKVDISCQTCTSNALRNMRLAFGVNTTLEWTLGWSIIVVASSVAGAHVGYQVTFRPRYD